MAMLNNQRVEGLSSQTNQKAADTSHRTWDTEITHMAMAIETMAMTACSRLTYVTRWVYWEKKLKYSWGEN